VKRSAVKGAEGSQIQFCSAVDRPTFGKNRGALDSKCVLFPPNESQYGALVEYGQYLIASSRLDIAVVFLRTLQRAKAQILSEVDSNCVLLSDDYFHIREIAEEWENMLKLVEDAVQNSCVQKYGHILAF
jgi:hypothetical protein